MLKAFYDSGNKIDSRKYEIVTLGGVYGAAEHWRKFEAVWRRIFQKLRPPNLHTKDAIALRPPYTKENGWDIDKVHDVISRCVDIIEVGTAANAFGLVCCTVVLSDYKQVSLVMPDLAPVEHLCTEYCIGIALTAYGGRLFEDGASLFFDQGDSFYGHTRNMWKRKDVRKRPVWNAITHVGEVDMRRVPGAQAADLLAWSLNRAHKDGESVYDWQRKLLGLRVYSRLIDAAFLNDVPRIEENVRRYHALRLPPRRPVP